MDTINDCLIPISIPITASDRQRISSLAQQLLTPELQEQVYRNALAVMVTHRYLQLLAIASDLSASVSWNPASQHPGNIADLYIPETDKRLECRSIHKGDTKCFIPEEVWRDRLGYVVVQLDDPYREGIVLGFVPEVSVTELPLSYLQPLDALIDCLIPEPTPILTSLSQWLKGIFEPDWEPNNELLAPAKVPGLLFRSLSPVTLQITNKNVREVKKLYIKQAQGNLSQNILDLVERDPEEALVQLIQTTQDDEIRWQAAELLAEINPSHPAGAVRSAKDLGRYLAGHSVALMVGVLPKPDGTMLVLARVHPVQIEPHLPTGLQLAGFDDAGNLFDEKQARMHDDCIDFLFTADPGDRFTLRVSLDDAAVTENFIAPCAIASFPMTHSPQNNTSPENLAIVLRFRMGNFEEGFPVTVEIKKNHETVENFDFRRIPAAPKLAERQHRWAELYKELRGRGISSVKEQITHESTMDKYVLADNALKAGVEEWLNHKDFELLKHHICNLARKAARVDQCKSVPVIIEIDSSNTEDDINLLRRIPWNCWSLFKELPNAEAVLSLQRSSQHDAQVKVLRHPVRILAIFGSSEGDLQFSDEQAVLERLKQGGAEITCLPQPSDNELHNSLWDHSYDILFFAGHSYSEPNLTSGFLVIRDGEHRSLHSLGKALKRAVNQGLKLAIFNSCDGLGIANHLADLGVPTMIVMREPVPDRVARKFLEYLLDRFSSSIPLYLAFREACERLQSLEDDHSYLAATRLPVIVQNPSQPELVWPSPPDNVLISSLG